jgi:hypothetical protein
VAREFWVALGAAALIGVALEVGLWLSDVAERKKVRRILRIEE